MNKLKCILIDEDISSMEVLTRYCHELPYIEVADRFRGSLRKIKIPFNILLIAFSFCFVQNANGQYTDLVNLPGVGYGGHALGNVTPLGNKFYGMSYGEVGAHGSIFTVYQDGSGYKNLYVFSGNSGIDPQGSLTLSGDTLYGMALVGGPGGVGTLFSYNIIDSTFKVLLNFNGYADGDNSLGAYPFGSITLSITGDTLYGMTNSGGIYGLGNVFSFRKDSTYTDLLDFDGVNGNSPGADITLSVTGDTLYGMTPTGGIYGQGNIFSIHKDGSSYNDLHDFDGIDGSYPAQNVTLSGNVLYGMTNIGGTSALGNIFSIHLDGSSFMNLHSFNGSDGENPNGSLTFNSGILYGMTSGGGSGVDPDGTIFSIRPDGTLFTSLYSFNYTSTTNTGFQPYGSLTILGNFLYGMTFFGRSTAQEPGVVFGFDPMPIQYFCHY